MIYIYIKVCLENYFTNYSPFSTKVLHSMSKANMNYLLGLANIFSEADMKFLRENIDLSSL